MVKTIEAKHPCAPGTCPHPRAQIITDLDEIVRLLRECPEPSFDLETTGYNPFLSQVECMSFSVAPEIAMWVPFVGSVAMPMSRAQGRLRDELENPDKTWIGHLDKFDMKHAWHKGFVGDQALSYPIPRGKVIDTCVASRKLDENKYSHELKELIKGPPFYHTMTRYDEVKKLRSPQADLFMSADKVLEEFRNYSCEDAVWTRRLWFEHLKPQIEREPRLAKLFYEMECRVSKALCAMECHGIKLDLEYMSKLDREFAERAQALVQEAYAIVGHPFEIDSPDALYRLLFEELKVGERGELRRTKGRDGGEGRISVDADTLEKYEDLPVVQKIMRYKALAKLRSTYTTPLQEHAKLVDGRIRSVFNQVPDERFGEAAVTGRLSSSDPNLQNIPIRPKPWEPKGAESDGHKIRKGFVSEDGYVFIVADNSQVELRCLAHITKDKELLRAYRRWDCHECKKKGYTHKPLHACPECGAQDGKRDKNDPKQPTIKGFCLGLDLHTITALACNITRDQGKVVNFALAGGMGVTLFSKALGLPRKLSDPIREAYFDHYSGVWEWFKTIPPALKKDGYIKTIMGSYRRFPQCKSQRVEMFSREWRQAANGSFQGSAADLMKIQLRNLHEEFWRRGWLGRVRIILVVHDEFIIECPEEMVDEVLIVTRDIMENAIYLDVPLLVSIGKGKTWGDAKG